MDRIKYMRIYRTVGSFRIPTPQSIHGRKDLPEPRRAKPWPITREQLERLGLSGKRDEKHSIAMIEFWIEANRRLYFWNKWHARPPGRYHSMPFTFPWDSLFKHHGYPSCRSRRELFTISNSKENCSLGRCQIFLEIDRDLQEIQDEPDILHKLHCVRSTSTASTGHEYDQPHPGRLGECRAYSGKTEQIMENLIQPISGERLATVSAFANPTCRLDAYRRLGPGAYLFRVRWIKRPF